MRIGLDFDNTIACYDGVFHAAALERGLLTGDVATDKTSVRDHLRARGRDTDFTALQGYVYGARMDLVKLFPGFLNALQRLVAAGHDIFVVSQKTAVPFAGPAYDLHAAARTFLERARLIGHPDSPLHGDNVFFEVTIDDKIARIRSLDCHAFVDDLPEILTRTDFPAATRAILFDCDDHHPGVSRQDRSIERYRSWDAIGDALLKG